MKPQLEIVLIDKKFYKLIEVNHDGKRIGAAIDEPYADCSATSVVELLAAMRDNGMIELTANDEARTEWKELNL